ncbi:MAG: ParB family transcriptional regulator, chromosome partitioning protein [Acidobacteriaceae bacterium]|jgi:ParB family chromosome partitioning protein|nr:ParB family transcriptional regulator, chromosome partitioning protein [Acidobacteriaceae bacterium]
MSTPDKRRALGKGLEALLPHRSQPAAAAQASSVATITAEADRDGAGSASSAPTGAPLELAVDLVDRNPFQTRTQFDEAALEELATSIAASGVVQPILVRLIADGRYQLIAGERRLLASRKAGKATIPAIVRQASDGQAMEMTIIENLQRADLNPMEQARAFDRLSREFQMTQEQMAKRTGKDRASVANFLRLLRLPPEIQGKVESGALSFGHARTLLALESPESMLKAAQKVLALSMSVRQTESFVQHMLNPEKVEKQPKSKEPIDPNVRQARDQLQHALGLKVAIEDKGGKGKVIIEYTNLEAFDTIMERITATRATGSA